MNFHLVHARCLSQILCEYRIHSYYLRNGILKNTSLYKLNAFKEPLRLFSSSVIHRAEEPLSKKEKRILAKLAANPSNDRSFKIPVEVSIRYLKSPAYKECYGDDPVWKHYRRNHKGSIPPQKTRRLCIRADLVLTGNPCPICRDEYLVVDHTNLDLLKQFISPVSGELFSYSVTGVCQHQHDKLTIAYLKAKDLGLVTFDVPFRKYNYSEYIETL